MIGVRTGPAGIVVAQCLPPFWMSELSDLAEAIRHGKYPGLSLSSPVLVDARAVRLARIDTSSFQRHVGRRAALQAGQPPNHVALVAGDLGSYGMLRMFSVLSEIYGVRPETMCLVTDSIGEATDWMAGVCDLDFKQAATLYDLVEPYSEGPLERRVPNQAGHQRDSS
jgi:hypothetical protein